MEKPIKYKGYLIMANYTFYGELMGCTLGKEKGNTVHIFDDVMARTVEQMKEVINQMKNDTTMKTIKEHQREVACNFTKYVAALKDYKCRSKKMRGLRELARQMVKDNGGYFYGNSVDLIFHFQDAFEKYGLNVGTYANNGFWGLYYNSTFKTIRFVVI